MIFTVWAEEANSRSDALLRLSGDFGQKKAKLCHELEVHRRPLAGTCASLRGVGFDKGEKWADMQSATCPMRSTLMFYRPFFDAHRYRGY